MQTKNASSVQVIYLSCINFGIFEKFWSKVVSFQNEKKSIPHGVQKDATKMVYKDERRHFTFELFNIFFLNLKGCVIES